MTIPDLFDRLLAEEGNTSFAPGFLDRLAVAQRLMSPSGAELPPARTVATPVYVTDLGVRLFADPAQFFHENLRLVGLAAPDPEESKQSLLSAAMPEFATWLDALTLAVGDYEACHDAIVGRLQELLSYGSSLACVYSGVVLAACGDDRALPLFRRAAETADSFPFRFMAVHRAAAAQMKRFGQISSAMDTLAALESEVTEYGKVSPGEAGVLRGVIKNLAALGHLMQGNVSDSEREEEAARDLLLSPVDPAMMDVSERGRYLGQVRINISQLDLEREGFTAAADAAATNVTLYRVDAPEYLSEALTAAGYYAYRAERYTAARVFCREAIRRIRMEASPTRLALARKILVGAYAKDGELERAELLAQHIDCDPLGLQPDE